MKGHARDLMSSHVARIEPDETLRMAAERITSGGFGGLPVVREGVVVGFVSETDVLGALLRSSSSETPVSEIMTSPAIVIDEFATSDDVMRTLREQAIHHLPVVRGDQLVGIISPKDVVRFFAERILPNVPAA